MTETNPCLSGLGDIFSITLFPSKDASVGYHDGYDSENTNYGDANHNSPFSQPSNA